VISGGFAESSGGLRIVKWCRKRDSNPRPVITNEGS
jgi:hypothetical protein